jgi:AcrR family transcriptional regulator
VPRAKQRTPELRDRLLDVAVSVLTDHGLSGLTTRRVAEAAGTSVPAVYELFDDKSGLLRAVFFEGFRRLGGELAAIPPTGDPLLDVARLAPVFRQFGTEQTALARVMFSRPLAGFDPGPDELAAGESVREVFVGRIEDCVRTGRLVGNPADIAHVLLALVQGLVIQEAGGWLGTSRASTDRRWTLGVQAVLDGFAH